MIPYSSKKCYRQSCKCFYCKRGRRVRGENFGTEARQVAKREIEDQLDEYYDGQKGYYPFDYADMCWCERVTCIYCAVEGMEYYKNAR